MNARDGGTAGGETKSEIVVFVDVDHEVRRSVTEEVEGVYRNRVFRQRKRQVAVLSGNQGS